MGVIKILSELTANKIAAGEVIERPASIVKELVENSLDAGAKSIEVIVEHGGKSLISVSDDGCGMSVEDAEMAFARHATSKIRNDKDLDAIATFGFRGEALPSIGAVSRVLMTTRMAKDVSGVQVAIDGGHKTQVRPAACRVGTIFEVRDLFFNTPARRKFLKSDNTELSHVQETIEKMALARQDVSFVLKSGNKTLLDLPVTKTYQERLLAIWGETTKNEWLEIQLESSDVKVHGFIGKPRISQANRLGQHFFINGRWVKAFSLSYALQAGYHGRLMQHQHPVGVIFVDLDLGRVDVNVHPTKQEVKISNESQIKNLLQEAISKRLAESSDMVPLMGNIQDREARMPGRSLEHEMINSSQDLVEHHRSGVSGSESATFSIKDTGLSYAPASSGLFSQNVSLQDQSPHSIEITKVLGQIHHTFILAETREGMVVIDQHAAHERIQFEVLMKGFESKKPAVQKLLMDEIIELNLRQTEILKESLIWLNQIGFEIDEFGEKSFILRAIPAIFKEGNPQDFILNYLQEKESGVVRTRAENLQEDIAALIACKRRSVKAHDRMELPAMQRMVEDLMNCKNPFGCPHGRPSFLKYSFLDLEKQFKRKL